MKYLFVGGIADAKIQDIDYGGTYFLVTDPEGGYQTYDYELYYNGKYSTVILLHRASSRKDVTQSNIKRSFRECNKREV